MVGPAFQRRQPLRALVLPLSGAPAIAGDWIVDAAPRDALWAFEQCLRSGACAAVLGWPLHADGPALRRLQVAADSGECLGFALRDRLFTATSASEGRTTFLLIRRNPGSPETGFSQRAR